MVAWRRRPPSISATSAMRIIGLLALPPLHQAASLAFPSVGQDVLPTQDISSMRELLFLGVSRAAIPGGLRDVCGRTSG